jgi:hypothetical protein
MKPIYFKQVVEQITNYILSIDKNWSLIGFIFLDLLLMSVVNNLINRFKNGFPLLQLRKYY